MRARQIRWWNLTVYLFFGVVITIAIAWQQAATWPPDLSRSSPMSLHWPSSPPADWPSTPTDSSQIRCLGVTFENGTYNYDVPLATKGRGPARKQIIVRQYGFPFRALADVYIRDETPNATGLAFVNTTYSAGWLRDGIRLPKPWSGGHHIPRKLPLQPLWTGLTLNALVFATIIAFLWWAPKAVLRKIRNHYQHCPNCGHDRRLLPADAPCTECGHPNAVASA